MPRVRTIPPVRGIAARPARSARFIGLVAACLLSMLAVLAGTAPAAAEDGTAEQLISAYGCLQCHSVDGTIPVPGVPRLAGQKEKYLARQLNHFKLGVVVYDGEVVAARRHEVMNDLGKRLSTLQLRSIAKFFSSKACKTNAGATPPRPDGVERCEVCHGGDRANPWRDTPSLNAQDETYLKRTIHDLWRARKGYDTVTGRHHRLAEVMFIDADEPNLDAYAEYFAAMPCGRK